MRQEASNSNPISLASRLEQGELIDFESAPFELPDAVDSEFLRSLELLTRYRKHISFDPMQVRLTGVAIPDVESRQRLLPIFRAFSNSVVEWLNQAFPEYRQRFEPDRISFRPDEEAVRTVRWSARNDLLHIDNFPNRPTMGRRILRVYVNLNPEDDRVWSVSEKYESLLKRFGRRNSIPDRTREEWLSVPSTWHRLLHGDWVGRSYYDQFQLELHHALKRDDSFQERASRQFRYFPPRSCWLLFSDALAHADLRGQHALEHSFFIPSEVMVEPSRSPLTVLVERNQPSFLRKVG
jgi:hypothetical protein